MFFFLKSKKSRFKSCVKMCLSKKSCCRSNPTDTRVFCCKFCEAGEACTSHWMYCHLVMCSKSCMPKPCCQRFTFQHLWLECFICKSGHNFITSSKGSEDFPFPVSNWFWLQVNVANAPWWSQHWSEAGSKSVFCACLLSPGGLIHLYLLLLQACSTRPPSLTRWWISWPLVWV